MIDLQKERLKKYRNEAGLTQVQVAERIGVSRRAYQHYEAGERALTGNQWVKLSKVLGKDIKDLLL